MFIADESEYIEISVEDNGIGIPQELHPILFNRFTKAERPGLSIVKTVVELHQGKI